MPVASVSVSTLIGEGYLEHGAVVTALESFGSIPIVTAGSETGCTSFARCPTGKINMGGCQTEKDTEKDAEKHTDNTTEEPQKERGPKGSCDSGPKPGTGPTHRPADDSDPGDQTGVRPLLPITDSPHLQGS
jgi:hypothetical protein